MTTFTHAASGSIVAVLVVGLSPNEYVLQLLPIFSAAILDLDHVYYFLNDKTTRQHKHMHKARSFLHELIGFIIIGCLMLGLSFVNIKLSLLVGIPMMIHLTEDVIMGVSLPFNPFDKTKMKLLPQNINFKIVIDIIVLLISGFLWIKFLSGQL